MGQLWAKVVPNRRILGISINPGPFTIKEHVLVTIMATVGYQSAYAVRLQCSFDHTLTYRIFEDRYCSSAESLLQPDIQF